jgi:hypothetical protein
MHTGRPAQPKYLSILINDYLQILDQSGWQETRIFQAPLSSERFKGKIAGWIKRSESTGSCRLD